ncbi:MAG: hypothetical protein JNL88_10335 [Bacteroidia bacterium]|nr:hypothetical protein [Bacteroidia bacterium]
MNGVKRKICLIFLLVFTLNTGPSFAQVSGRSIPSVSNFELDPLGNCYYQSGSDIIKLNKEGKELVRYSMKDLGRPSSFDVGNPMRILVFYAEFAIIRILDNNLVDQSELDLRTLGLLQPKAIAGTPDQGIWIFEEISGALIKLDAKLNTPAISVDLNQLLGRRPSPSRLLANQEWLIFVDQQEVIVFDQFGTKFKSIPFHEKPRLVQIAENELTIDSGDELLRYQLRLNQLRKEKSTIPTKAIKAYLSEEKYWFIQDQNLFLAQ